MNMEVWMIILIIAIIIILICVFIYIIYRISISDGSFLNMKKNGFFFDPDTGAVGSFIGIEGEGKNLVDVIYAPLNSPFTKAKIRNVPAEMVPKLTFSTESKIAGVQSDGYMILGTGAHSKRRLFDAINEEWNGKVSGLVDKLNDQKTALSVANKEKDMITKGIDNAISKINTRKDDDNKKGGRPGGMGRHSSWDSDDDDF